MSDTDVVKGIDSMTLRLDVPGVLLADYLITTNNCVITKLNKGTGLMMSFILPVVDLRRGGGGLLPRPTPTFDIFFIVPKMAQI